MSAGVTSDESQSRPAGSDVDLKSHQTFDIEHMPVEDDPRGWSSFRKNVVLALVSSASMIAGLASNIQNPAIAEMEADLPATASQISWSLSSFIALQGVMPLFWSAISEVKGRKLVYVVSIAISTAGSVVVANEQDNRAVSGQYFIPLYGSGYITTLRVILFDAYKRLGAATLADIFDPVERGQKMGIYYMGDPIMGGVLTTGFSWRAPFCGVLILLFLKDTFRKERSLTYQNVLKSRLRSLAASAATSCTATVVEKEPTSDKRSSLPADLEKQPRPDPNLSNSPDVVAALPNIKLTLSDVNPIKPLWLVVRRMNNLVILFASGLCFAFNFIVVFTASRTLSSAYGYNALKVGLVLLSFGLGNLAGSLARLKAANGGVSYPEMRLESTKYGLIFLPPSVLAYGWVSENTSTSPRCVWAYTSTLAYIVDANNGRSATAVATNSAFRGMSAFVATEIAVPLQDSVGDGWLYTIWTGLLVFVGLLVWLVVQKGGAWREAAEKREQEAANK
ncbi:major facilitator superfamily domain-containing protein [Mycena haematopus]|nr:major facilitator superfamily domain-containing protein [Mycena haematopus]